MILYDFGSVSSMNFIFIFDNTINLVSFDITKFGSGYVYSNDDCKPSIDNQSEIKMIKGYHTVSEDGDYEERLFTIEKDSLGQYLIRDYHIIPESDTINQIREIVIGNDEVTSIDMTE
jgi:hypothetical protein